LAGTAVVDMAVRQQGGHPVRRTGATILDEDADQHRPQWNGPVQRMMKSMNFDTLE
jgi:hypothetical protein